MKRILILPLLVALAFGCDSNDVTDVTEEPFEMSNSDLSIDWVIVVDEEESCGGNRIAGGEISGHGDFTHLGRSEVNLSSAWNIGDLLEPGEVQYEPVSPAAAGPVAPVLSEPYSFNVNPFESPPPPSDPVCEEDAVTATAEVELTAEDGDQVFGEVVGGETHRLDFEEEGDGIENFIEISIVGGTGRFEDAEGSFVVHAITRFDYDAGMFVIDQAEVLSGGRISY